MAYIVQAPEEVFYHLAANKGDNQMREKHLKKGFYKQGVYIITKMSSFLVI